MKPATPEEKSVYRAYKLFFQKYKRHFFDLIQVGLLAIYEKQSTDGCIENNTENHFIWIKAASSAMSHYIKQIRKFSDRTISLDTPITNDTENTYANLIGEPNEIYDQLNYKYLLKKVKSVFAYFSPIEQKMLKSYFNSQQLIKTAKKYDIKKSNLQSLINQFREQFKSILIKEDYLQTNKGYEKKILTKKITKLKQNAKGSLNYYYKKMLSKYNCSSIEEYKHKQEQHKQENNNFYSKYTNYLGVKKETIELYIRRAKRLNIDLDTYIKKYVVVTLFENLIYSLKISDLQIANVLKIKEQTAREKRLHINKFYLFEIVKIKNVFFPNYDLKSLVQAGC